MNVNVSSIYQCSDNDNCSVHYDRNINSISCQSGLVGSVENSVNRMEDDLLCSSDIRTASLSQDESDLINSLVEEISSLSISQKYGVDNKRNHGNVLKVRLKDSGTALGNRKIINVRFMDSERDVKTTIVGASRKRIDKNFVKQGGGTRKPRGKTQGVSKKY